MTATIKEVRNTVDAVKNVNRDIRNYYWMANQIDTKEAKIYIQATNHSVESSLPTAPYTNSDPTYRIAQRNIRIEERKKRLLDKVTKLENAVATLEDERERIVVEGCMDRMTLHQIGVVLGISKQAVYEIKEKAVQKLAVKMYLKN